MSFVPNVRVGIALLLGQDRGDCLGLHGLGVAMAGVDVPMTLFSCGSY